MKLILLPLAILIMVALLSVFGLGSGTFGGINLNNGGIGPESVLYTLTGHPTVYANGTAIGEAGQIIDVEGVSGVAHWYNATSTYTLYTDSACTQIARLVDTVAPLGGGSWSWTGSISSSIGLMALVGGLMLLVAVVGARFLTYGQSEFGISTIYKSTAYIAVWGVFSVLALPLMIEFPLNLGYFLLTIIYTLGIINSAGTPDTND